MSSDMNGWSRQEAAVLYRLDELSADLKELNREVVKLREGIAALKVQAQARTRQTISLFRSPPCPPDVSVPADPK